MFVIAFRSNIYTLVEFKRRAAVSVYKKNLYSLDRSAFNLNQYAWLVLEHDINSKFLYQLNFIILCTVCDSTHGRYKPSTISLHMNAV